MRILILSNAATPRARQAVPALRDALPESSRVEHLVSDTAAAADAPLTAERWQPDDLLVINGGDGSVQHALSVLLANHPAAQLPQIACLPGGSTNMTAYDLNRHRGMAECLTTLRRLTASPAAVAPEPRPVVRVTARGTARCGLFFGAGSIVEGVKYFQERLRGAGGRHELAAGAALARTAWGIARRERTFAEPLAATVRAASFWPTESALSLRLVFATTLNRLFLGIRPYWGAGDGALKITAVERRAPGFLGRLPRLLRGRPDVAMTPANGYHSGRVADLDLAFRGSYTLDGELFPAAGDKMRVCATEPVRFVPL